MILVLFVAESLFLGYCGWLLIFRKSTIVGRAHNIYGCKFFLKPWYSIFMRCMGIFIWLLGAVASYRNASTEIASSVEIILTRELSVAPNFPPVIT
jgi:hypothetical protein